VPNILLSLQLQLGDFFLQVCHFQQQLLHWGYGLVCAQLTLNKLPFEQETFSKFSISRVMPKLTSGGQ
jgi:hypothetical protein